MFALSAALPTAARLPVGVALILALVAADMLVYDAAVGLGFALFLAALAALAGFAAPEPPSRRRVSVATAMQVAALAPILLQSNALTFAIAVLGTFAACLALRGTLHGAAIAEFAAQSVIAPFRAVPLFRDLGRAAAASAPRAKLLAWVLPGAFAAVFVALFADANPLIAHALDGIDFGAVFDLVLSDRPWFLFWMAVFAAPFLHPAVRQSPRLLMAMSAMSLLRAERDEEAALLRRWNEAGFAARSLLLFNAVFAVQTATDLLYLYSGVGLPDGMSFAEYAHRGAYPLLATAILAALFVVWTTQPDGPASTSPLVTKLVLLWVSQNVLLLVSSVYRLDLYVDAMGLTYWRVAAFVWMGLTAAGFGLILVRGFRGLSLGWLVSANVVALVAALYAVAFVDWADVIARSQLARADGGCPAIWYVRGIGASALPAVHDAARARGEPILLCDGRSRANRDLQRLLRQEVVQGDWRALTVRRLTLEQIASTPYATLERKPVEGRVER